MKKITTIDQLTFYFNQSYYRVEIPERATSARSIDDLEEIEKISALFFEVDSISKSDEKYHIDYFIPEGYKPFVVAKKFELISKLQLLQRFLAYDPLADGTKSFLDLNNVFFKDFKNIKLLYRSNGHLPYHSILPLEQYKLFALGFLSRKFSYKKYLRSKDILLKKEDNEIFYKINNVQSISDLKFLINDLLTEEQSRYHDQIKQELDNKKKKKKVAWTLRGVIAVVIGLSFLIFNQSNQETIAKNFETEIKNLELDNEILISSHSGLTKKAAELMKDRGDEPEDIANLFLDTGMYDAAIETYPDIEGKVIDRLYELNQIEKILSLESDSEFITYEKQIVEYDIQILDRNLDFIENEKTLKRLALAHINNEEYGKLENVQMILNDPELEDYVTRSQLISEISRLNQQIYIIGENSDENYEEVLSDLNKNLVRSQQELIIIEAKLGIDNQ